MLILLIIRMFNTPACVLTTIFQKTDALEWAILVFTIKIQFTSPGCLLITAQVVSIFSKDNAISIHSTVCRQTANLSSYSVLRNFSLFLERSVFKTCRDLTETPPPPTGITTHPVLTSTVNSSTTWNGTSAPPSASTQRSTSQWSTTGKPASSKTTTETTTTIRENCYSLYTNSHYSSKFICIYLSINSQQYGSTWKHSRNNIAFNLRHDSH
eukprot:m.205201 g.205201  ORF g.205201 m.205201 type:complete len:212 (+) comp39657_c1_seq32:700-1335(+)